ncbi:hypothetical protein [Nesterenkonia pannonica]|uniref:hypothetical protein n=1 Tax=Nesterenkonia pannonica TaxID=1548602 RepID=UPI0021649294|nr:hypothetical protein [Nesterenkonia pannonica]
MKTLHAARFALKAVLTEGLVDEASRTAQIEPWFEPLSEGLASGAPVQRTEEMAALVRAGLIEVLGPSPIFAVDSSAGLFAARSPQVPDVQHTASHLIEAMMPPNRVGQADEPLIRTLLRSGEARPAVLAGAEHKGFDVSPSPHRLLSTVARSSRSTSSACSCPPPSGARPSLPRPEATRAPRRALWPTQRLRLLT